MTINQTLEQYQAMATAPLDEAKALPFEVYHDPKIYELERRYVFQKEWVFLCAEKQIPDPGDYFACELAGEAVAIVHGQDGKIRALSNICRHRGTPLLDEGFGHIDRHIICPYHAWAYDDQGALKGAPHVSKISLDKTEHCLPHFRLESWRGCLFVNLDPEATSVAERFMGIDRYLNQYDWGKFKQGYRGQTERWQANWKLAIENGIESYHLFKVHQATLEPMTPTKQSFYVAGSSEWTVTAGKFVDTRGKIEKWLSGSYPEALNHYLLISLPPSFIGILSFDSFSWIQILPDGPEHCVVRSGALAAPGGDDSVLSDDPNISAFLNEDQVIVERVQRGMHSRHSQGGKLVDMEQVVVDFRQYLGSRLFGDQPLDFVETEAAKIFL